MIERFTAAIRKAIFVIDRPFMDIAAKVGLSRQTIYKITKTTSEIHKPNQKNAYAFMAYLNSEIDNKIREHVREVKHLRQIKDELSESYAALYPEKKKQVEDDDA